MTGSMVEVDRTALLGKLRKAREHAIAEHERAVAAYQPALDAWNLKAAAKLEATAARIREGKPVDIDHGYHGGVTFGNHSDSRRRGSNDRRRW